MFSNSFPNSEKPLESICHSLQCLKPKKSLFWKYYLFGHSWKRNFLFKMGNNGYFDFWQNGHDKSDSISKKGLFRFKTLYNFTQPEAIQRSWGCEVRFRRGVCQSLLTCQIPSFCPLRRPWPSFCRAWNTACFPNLGGYAPWCRPRDVWYTLRDWPLFCQRRRLIRETACISWWDRFLWAFSI